MLSTGAASLTSSFAAASLPSPAGAADPPRNPDSERFIIDTDGPVLIRTAFRGKIKELQHGRSHHPLIAHQRLDDLRVGITRAGDQFARTEFGIEVTPDIPH